MKSFFRLFLFLISPQFAFSQESISISNNLLTGEFEVLNFSGKQISQDILAAEKLVNLVRAETTFPVFQKNKQRHVIPIIGWAIDKFGKRNWVALDSNKKKFVGTSTRPMKIFEGVGKEYDYNIYLSPHLDDQVTMIRHGLDETFQRHRSEKDFKIDNPPFPCAKGLELEGGCLTVECENTPNPDFIKVMDSLFISTRSGIHPFREQPNFGTDFPSIGVYGVFCLDCNHNCRPEIHPIEWIWWSKNDSTLNETYSKKTWFAGLIHDRSERFNDWSPAPLEGTIAIPFAIPSNRSTISIRIDNLLLDPAVKNNLNRAELNFEKNSFFSIPGIEKFQNELEIEGRNSITFEIHQPNPLEEKYFKAGIGELNFDMQKKIFSGYLYLSVITESAYAVKIEISSK